MPDFEKTVKGLECCTSINRENPDEELYMGDCENCPMKNEEYIEKGIAACEPFEERAVALPYQLVRDALALLKAQEPRVMTWEEAKASVNDGPFIIFEVRDSTGSELDFGVLVDDSYEMSEGSLLTVESFPKMEDAYCKRFRMWTSRPTKEQMEATPWTT